MNRTEEDDEDEDDAFDGTAGACTGMGSARLPELPTLVTGVRTATASCCKFMCGSSSSCSLVQVTCPHSRLVLRRYEHMCGAATACQASRIVCSRLRLMAGPGLLYFSRSRKPGALAA